MNKKKVVLAEDDKFYIKIYKHALETEGYEVIVAVNGVEASDAMKNKNPDLVLLDLIMPVKNGFEVLEEVSTDPKLSKIPIVILSNLGQTSDVEKGKGLGAVDYIIKSDESLSGVMKKVKEHLQSKV